MGWSVTGGVVPQRPEHDDRGIRVTAGVRPENLRGSRGRGTDVGNRADSLWHNQPGPHPSTAALVKFYYTERFPSPGSMVRELHTRQHATRCTRRDPYRSGGGRRTGHARGLEAMPHQDDQIRHRRRERTASTVSNFKCGSRARRIREPGIVELEYNMQAVRLVQLADVLSSTGCGLHPGPCERIRRRFIRYTGQNELDHIRAPRRPCTADPKFR